MKNTRYVFFFLLLTCCHTTTAQWYINAITRIDTCGYAGDGGPAIIAVVKNPQGLCRDKAGNLYIGDDGGLYIRKIDATTRIITTIAGGGALTMTGDSIPATSAYLYHAPGLCIDTAGNLLIADGKSRIRKVNLTTGIITTVAGTLVAAYTGDGGPATAATLSDPLDVKVDTANNIYISDNNNSVIRKVDAVTGIISTIAGIGICAYLGDGGPAIAANLCGPEALFVDKHANIYISDNGSCLRKITAATGIISTIAGTGTHGFSGDGGPATDAKCYNIFGIAVDDTGNVYMADAYNNRIRKVSAATGIITTIAGNGIAVPDADTTDHAGPATNSKMSPFQLCLDSCGNIFFTDGCSVQVLTPTSAPYTEGCPHTGSLGASPRPSLKERGLAVYPNPSTGTFTISISSPVDEQAQVIVTNMVGVKVKELTTESNRAQDVQLNVPAGIYFIAVSSSGGRYVQKVVVE